MVALILSNNEFLLKFSVSLCQKLGVEEQNGVQVIKETVAEFQAIIAEDEARNVCKAVIKAGDNKGQVCGKKFKEGLCPVHKPHSHSPKELAEDNGPKCELILKNGERVGQPCGKKCVENEDRCAVHMRFPTPGNGCAYVFSRGDRAGQTCDKKRENDEDAFCLFHKQAQAKSESKSEKSESKPKEKKEKSEKKEKKEKNEKKENLEKNEKSEATDQSPEKIDVEVVSDVAAVAAYSEVVASESSASTEVVSKPKEKKQKKEKSESSEPKEKKQKKEKSESSEPKEKKQKKEKSDSKPKAEEKPVYEQMRCVRRGESLAIKGTQIAVNDSYEITGWVKNEGSTEEPKWVLMKEYFQGMEDAVKLYGVKCEFKPSSAMLVEDDE